jgi:hypothetical protein
MTTPYYNAGSTVTFPTRELADLFIALNSHQWDGYQVGPVAEIL